MKDVEKVVELVIKEYGKELLKKKHVVGYSNKPKKRIRKGVKVDEDVLRVYVDKKVPLNELKKEDVIPRELEVEGKKIRTDVVEVGRFKALAVYTSKYRPVPSGVSTGRADNNATGTVGWFLVDANGDIYVMSNNHVWCKDNTGSPGDPLIQPGLADGGNPDTDVFAYLTDYIPIDFSGNPNTVDLAFAKVSTEDVMKNVVVSIADFGGVYGSISSPSLNDIVAKIGRTTGYTEGTVTDDSATINIEYNGQTALFTDVFIVEGTSIVGAGDSGSPVIKTSGDTRQFCGMLFAGNDNGTMFVACKAGNIVTEVQNKLGVNTSILSVNSPKPFETKVEYKYIYVEPGLDVLVYNMIAISAYMLMFVMLTKPIIAISRSL